MKQFLIFILLFFCIVNIANAIDNNLVNGKNEYNGNSINWLFDKTGKPYIKLESSSSNPIYFNNVGNTTTSTTAVTIYDTVIIYDTIVTVITNNNNHFDTVYIHLTETVYDTTVWADSLLFTHVVGDTITKTQVNDSLILKLNITTANDSFSNKADTNHTQTISTITDSIPYIRLSGTPFIPDTSPYSLTTTVNDSFALKINYTDTGRLQTILADSLASIAYTYRVSKTGGKFTTICDCIDFLNASTDTTGVRIIIDGGTWVMSETHTIDAVMPILFEGSGSGSTLIKLADSKIASGSPMFTIKSNIDFNKMSFYGCNSTNTQCINNMFLYNTDTVTTQFLFCNFYNCDTAIKITSNAFVLNYFFYSDGCTTLCEINAPGKATTIDFGTGDCLNYKKAIDIINCDSGNIYLSDLRLHENAAGDIAVNYNGGYCTYTQFIIKGCSNNSISDSTYNGFDFTRTDGRDANIYLQYNLGKEDKNPHGKVNVINNALGTTLTTQNVYYLVTFTDTTQTYYTCKWKVETNKITYLSKYQRDGFFIICGNINVDNVNQNIDLAISKNGDTTVANVYSSITQRLSASGTYYQFGINAYLEDIQQNDYFQIVARNTSSAGKVIIIADLNWLIMTR